MGSPSLQYSGPAISPDVPWETRHHLQLLYTKVANHAQAFTLLSQKVNTLKPGTTTTEVVGGGTGGGSVSGVSGIAVNNQSGVTSYTTMAGDNLALLVFSDASAIAVSLTSEDPPFGCFVANIGALGQGTVTLTPQSGDINGAASLAIFPSYGAVISFDGANWYAMTMPIVPQSISPIAGEFLTGYTASTGIFSQAAPTGLSVTITTAKLTTGGTEGSMTYTNGLLTAQVAAT